MIKYKLISYPYQEWNLVIRCLLFTLKSLTQCHKLFQFNFDPRSIILGNVQFTFTSSRKKCHIVNFNYTISHVYNTKKCAISSIAKSPYYNTLYQFRTFTVLQHQSSLHHVKRKKKTYFVLLFVQIKKQTMIIQAQVLYQYFRSIVKTEGGQL